MNIKLSSHGFLFPRNINRRENKAQIPLIIHHNEKNQRIYFWCAAKDNWASQISDVALRKELEQWVSKGTPRTTAGELQKIVESRGQKTFKRNDQTAPTSPHVWEGFKKYYPSSSKNKLQNIQLSDTTGTSHGIASFFTKLSKNSTQTLKLQISTVRNVANTNVW